MATIKTAPVRLVSEFVRRLRQTPSSKRRLFRGQNTDKPLLPRIARLAEKQGIPFADITGIERQMLERFRRESVPMLGGIRADTDWELLSIAQHQGMPTRLLDWTANALAGLWFAVSSDPLEDEPHGVVWVLDVDPTNETSPTPTEDLFGLKNTFVFQPFHLDRRIVAQSAWFSIHRYAESKNKFISLEHNSRFQKALTKYIVPRGQFDSLRRELRLLGVSQASMFPDLSGLGADIQAEFIDSWRPLGTI
jgi:FRG domain